MINEATLKLKWVITDDNLSLSLNFYETLPAHTCKRQGSLTVSKSKFNARSALYTLWLVHCLRA